jgi:hypothetical protein
MGNVRIAVLLLSLSVLGCEGRKPIPGPCEASPTSLNFGLVESTGPQKTLRFTLRNKTEKVQQVRIAPLAFPFGVSPVGLVPLVAFNGSVEVQVGFDPADGRLSVDEVVMSTEDGTCDVTVPVRGIGSGSLRADPAELEFTLGKGETQTKELQIVNTRRVEVTLKFTAPPGVTLTLPNDRKLGPGGAMIVPVKATLNDWPRQDGVITVTTTELERLEIPVALIPSSPRVEITPTPPIEIPVIGLDVNAQSFAERTFRIRNAGTSGDPLVPKLDVRSFGLTSIEPFDQVIVSEVPFTQLAENESMEVSVRIIPQQAGPNFFQFQLVTNADSPLVQIRTRAAELPPCRMNISPTTQLVLHEVPDGGMEGAVTFRNDGTNACTVDGVRLNFDLANDFSVSGAMNEQFRVLPNEEQQVIVAGPWRATGVLGTLRYHVFQKYSDVKTISVEAP